MAHVGALEKLFKFFAKGCAKGFGSNDDGSDDVHSDVLSEQAAVHVTAHHFHYGFRHRDKVVIGSIVVGTEAGQPDHVARVSAENIVDFSSVVKQWPRAVFNAFE